MIILGLVVFSLIGFGLGILVGMMVWLPSELEEREEQGKEKA